MLACLLNKTWIEDMTRPAEALYHLTLENAEYGWRTMVKLHPDFGITLYD